MPITNKQAAARRANGKLSHGPVTAAGKAVCAQNALKHGFFGIKTLVPGESADDFAAFRERLFEALEPADAAEELLVEQIADQGWRLRRLPAVEAALYSSELLEEQATLVRRRAKALLDHRLQPDPSEAKNPEEYRKLLRQEAEIREQLNSPDLALGRVFRRDAQAGAAFQRLSRCEMMLQRGFHKSWNALQQRQAARKVKNAEQTYHERETPQNQGNPIPPQSADSQSQDSHSQGRETIPARQTTLRGTHRSSESDIREAFPAVESKAAVRPDGAVEVAAHSRYGQGREAPPPDMPCS